jgi:hypothetical protein
MQDLRILSISAFADYSIFVSNGVTDREAVFSKEKIGDMTDLTGKIWLSVTTT